MAVAPGGELEAVRRLGDGERLILEHIDRQRAQALDLVEIIQRHRHRSVSVEHEAHVHLLVDPGGLVIFRRMRRHVRDARDAHGRSAHLGGCLRAKELRQGGDAGRAAAIERDGLGDGRAVAQVVRVVLDLQIAIRAAAPGVGDGFRLAAVGGRVIAGHVFAADRADDAAGFLHGLHAAVVTRGRAVINLIAGGIHNVVGRRLRAHLLERIGARCDGLRLERLQREGIVHLIREHAAHVVLHIHMHDDLHIAALGNELDIARIKALRLSRLRDAHAIFAGGLMPPELEAAAHRLRACAHRQMQRAASVGYGERRTARNGAVRIAADGIAAVHRHIH